MTRYKTINGETIECTAEEIAELDSMKADWDNKAFDRAIAEVRFKRDRLIAETDYLALSDQTLSAEMSTYRQALRDITNGITTVEQANNITWPTKP